LGSAQGSPTCSIASPEIEAERRRKMSETSHRKMDRKARVIVTRTFGEPCLEGYQVGDSIPVDLKSPEGAFRCPAIHEALEPYLGVAQESTTPEPLQFAASCHCPRAKSEVVFYLRVSPPLHQHSASA
jgi:uncharacterized repeat protein (TIGR04076 family)